MITTNPLNNLAVGEPTDSSISYQSPSGAKSIPNETSGPIHSVSVGSGPSSDGVPDRRLDRATSVPVETKERQKRNQELKTRQQAVGLGIRRSHRDSGGYAFIKPTLAFASALTPKQMETPKKRRPPTSKEWTSTSESDVSSETSSLLKRRSLPSLTGRQIFVMATLATAELTSTTAFACIAPFFPNEAVSKGATQSEIGIIFGVVELVTFILAPIWGKLLPRFGSKLLFNGGLLMTGMIATLFGFLKMIPGGFWFVSSAVVLRVMEAVGDSAYVTATFAIAAKEFPGRITLVIGILETTSGLGLAFGPSIGGALYQLGGFSAPFFVLGSLLFTVAISSVFLVKSYAHEEDEEHSPGMLSLLRTPGVLVMVLAVMLCSSSLTFLDPTLERHLAQFRLTPFFVGVMFLLCGATYAAAAPLWGYIVARSSLGGLFMVLGALCAFMGMLLVGPSPLIQLQPSLWVIGMGLAVIGLSLGALFIPAFSGTLDLALENGYPDSLETYGVVSGILNSVFSLGGFFGPTVGSLGVQMIGFAWTSTIVGFGHIAVMFLLILYFCCCSRGRRKRYSTFDSDDSSFEFVIARDSPLSDSDST